LIVNDEFFILDILRQMFENLGIINIKLAQNGFDGLQMVLKEQFDAVICDLNMPVLNGFQCAKKIRASLNQKELLFSIPKEDEYCPLLVAFSANITPEIERKCLASGFDFAI